MTPQIEIEGDTATVKGPRGFMRMLLTGALTDANLWQRAQGASPETRQRWARRAIVMRGLLDAMPAPPSTRDPFEDLGEEAASAAPAITPHLECPKCGAISGDDWKQCGGQCPMPQSPHYEFKSSYERSPVSVPLTENSLHDAWDGRTDLSDDILGLLG